MSIFCLKKYAAIAISFIAINSYAAEMSNSCLKGCESMQSAQTFLNTPQNTGKNCAATQAVCDVAVANAGKEDQVTIVTDYDGSISAEHLSISLSPEVVEKLGLNQAVFPSDVGSENSFAFGVVAPLLHALGYETGMIVAGKTPAEIANNIAARNYICEKESFDSTQQKFGMCIGDRTVGMTNEQVLNIHRIMYAVFPVTANYLTTPMSYQNFLAAQGFNTRYTQSGGTRWPTVVKPEFNPQIANAVWGSEVCVSGTDNACPVVADTPALNADGKLSITLDTNNVCMGKTYNEDFSDDCVDDGKGKAVGGMKTIQRREADKPVVYNNVNSGGDVHVAQMIWEQGGTVTVNDNSEICQTILANASEKPGVCVDVVNPNSETHPEAIIIDQKTLDALGDAAESLGLKQSKA